MSYVNGIDKLVAKGLYPDKSNVIYVGVTYNGKREFYSYGAFPKGIHQDEAIFEIGSMTKVFTTILLAQLVNEGVVRLDDPIEKFKPLYKDATTLNGKQMTLRHLATHTSGLPREDKALRKKLLDKKNPYKHYLKEDLDLLLQTYNLKKAEKWNYSNIGVALLASVLEEIVGIPYEQAIQERICRKLGLLDTVFLLHDEQQQRRIKAFTKKKEPIPQMEVSGIIGAGGLHSTMNDIMRFIEINMGIIESNMFDILQLTHQKHADGVKKKFDMGLGWFIEYNKKLTHNVIWTGGTTVGFHTYTGFIKERNLGVVVLSSYHLNFWELIKVILGKGPVVTDRIAKVIFEEL